jgi:hypothetical protein
MVRDFEFEKSLLLGDYKIAFDPLTRRYVQINGIEIDDNGVVICGKRFSDAQIDRYRPNELIRYA